MRSSCRYYYLNRKILKKWKKSEKLKFLCFDLPTHPPPYTIWLIFTCYLNVNIIDVIFYDDWFFAFLDFFTIARISDCILIRLLLRSLLLMLLSLWSSIKSKFIFSWGLSIFCSLRHNFNIIIFTFYIFIIKMLTLIICLAQNVVVSGSISGPSYSKILLLNRIFFNLIYIWNCWRQFELIQNLKHFLI